MAEYEKITEITGHFNVVNYLLRKNLFNSIKYILERKILFSSKRFIIYQPQDIRIIRKFLPSY